MSRAIEHVTINGEDDGRLVLGNAQVAAKLVPLDNGWTRLRIGVRLSFEDIGSNITGTPVFWIGAMSNPSSSMANGPLSSTTSNFVGIKTNSPTWVRTVGGAGAPILYDWSNGSGWVMIHKSQNSTQTGTSNIGGVNKYVSASTSSYRSAIIVDIKKGGSGFTGSMLVIGNTNVPDISLQKMKNAMEQSALTSAATELTGSYSTVIDNFVACDESSGSLNAICVAWDRFASKVHISDILWTNFAS